MSNQILDSRGGTLEDLLSMVDMKKVDRLAERFRKGAVKAQPVTAIEVMMAAFQIAGETALEFIPNPHQRKAVCAALAGYAVRPEWEGLQ
jgi:hypothetical protein